MWPSLFVEMVEGRASLAWRVLLFPFLFPASLLFRLALCLRHAAYDCGLLRTRKIALPVISVGNLLAGGVGKTPFVALLAERLSGQGRCIAVVSRGYGRLGIASTLVDPQNSTACEVGDEPLLLAKNFPNLSIWVAADRVEGAEAALAGGADLILLDDGMQHRALSHNLEVVLLDPSVPLSPASFLPWGCYRDLPKRLKHASLIVLIDRPSPSFLRRLRLYSQAPQIVVTMRLARSWKGERVALFSAIGRPFRVESSLRSAGAEVLARRFLPDHTLQLEVYIQEFAEEALRAGADKMVCTAKDAIKLPNSLSLPLPLEVVQAKMEILEGDDLLESFLEMIPR